MLTHSLTRVTRFVTVPAWPRTPAPYAIGAMAALRMGRPRQPLRRTSILHNQDRRAHRVPDVVNGRAVDHVLDPAVPVRAHNDQIGPQAARRGNDLVGGAVGENH